MQHLANADIDEETLGQTFYRPSDPPPCLNLEARIVT